MKTRIVVSIAILAAFLGIGFLTSPVMSAMNPPCTFNQVIRLHVVANSDKPDDQAAKMKVRDAIIREYGAMFCNLRDSRKAETAILNSLPHIEAVARRELKAAGKKYGAHAVYGVFDFPTRTYTFATLPAGRYRALRVYLGQGTGANWWCVLYPPLCFITEEQDAAARSAAKSGKPVQWRLAFIENLLKRRGIQWDSFWKSWGLFFGARP